MPSLLLRTGEKYQEVDNFCGIPEERQAGTLAYTIGGLLITCLYLLIGSFGYHLISQVVGNLLPKQISDAGASNTTIALLVTTLPSIIVMVCNPVFSTWSDRTKTRFGRRRPFLLISAPVITVFMICIGWTPEISIWIRQTFDLSDTNLGLVLIGIFSVFYYIAFMFPGAVLWYLFPDVIPNRFIARYMAFFNVVAQAAGVVFGSWLIPLAGNNIEWLYTASALFFMMSMIILCLTVKEGEFPPVEHRTQSLPDAVKMYFFECYRIPFYYWFFVAMSLCEVSVICRGMFNLLYAQNTLGISLESYGKILSYGAVIGVTLSIPFAWISDKMHPMRFFMLSLCTVIAVNLGSYFWVCNEKTFLISSILLALVYTMQTVSTIPVFVIILPKAQYGQFSSANALFRALFMAICGYGGGVLFDYVKDYQYIYLWDFVFTVATLLCFIVLYHGWKQRGGEQSYQAPMYHWKKTVEGNLQCL